MRKSPLSVAIVTSIGVMVSSAQAFPVSPQIEGPTGNTVQVRDFCGLGWHRDPYGYCRPNGAPYFYGPYAEYNSPGVRCWIEETPYGPRRVCGW
jgi:hypothetical protein